MHKAYELIKENQIAELSAKTVHVRHIKTGCEVFHIINNDEENLFAFTFKTPASDNTGVTHILEHSVLCGSKNFPLKDAFITLSRKTVNTFLNAFTFPDKTVYPASSTLKSDYYNLLRVYGDAVFFPLITKEIFMQEGHRFDYDENQKVALQGVVFNEMKGAYSDPENLASRMTTVSLFPDHCYGKESGGNPLDIPSLTYEAFIEKYKLYYSPTNCKIFLSGNIDTDEQLAFLDEHFLSKLEKNENVPELPIPEKKSLCYEAEIKVSAQDEADMKNTILWNYYIDPITDPIKTLTMEIVAEALIGHDGSPINKVLIDSGLGEDLAPQAGLELDLATIIFTTGLRGIDSSKKDALNAVFFNELTRLGKEGISTEAIEAAIHAIDFSTREIKRAYGAPYSLKLMLNAMRLWLYGEDPNKILCFRQNMDAIKKAYAQDKDYFNKFFQKHILTNEHRSSLIIKPSRAEFEKQKDFYESYLKKNTDSKGKIAKENYDALLDSLKLFQNKDDSEALKSFPTLSLKDLPEKIEVIQRRTKNISNLSYLEHAVHTNGIAYIELAFSLKELDSSDYLWLPLFTKAITSLGLKDLPYFKVQHLLTMYTGGFSAYVQNGTSLNSESKKSEAYCMFRLKVTEEDLKNGLDLVFNLILNADFSDSSRILDLFKEYKNQFASSVIPGGAMLTKLRAQANLSESCALDEKTGGLSQLFFLNALASSFDLNKLSNVFEVLRNKIIVKENCTISVTAQENFLPVLEKSMQEKVALLPTLKAKEKLDNFEGALPALSNAEVWLANTQVGYSALAFKGPSVCKKEYVHELMLSQLLSSKELWNEIRMKGGVYGAWATSDGIDETFTFTSYRDPDPSLSIKAYTKIMEDFIQTSISDDLILEGKITTVAMDLTPMSPQEKGVADFKRYLYNISDEVRQNKRTNLLQTQNKDLQNAAKNMLERMQKANYSLLCNSEAYEKGKTRLNDALARQIPLQ